MSRPSHNEALREAILGILMGRSFPLPGIVQDFNGETWTASVKPALKARTADDELQERAVIPNVPCCFFSAGGFAIHSAPSPGDECFLVYAGRSLDVFKQNGGVVDPDDGRLLHGSDCVAILGAFSSPMARAGGPVGSNLWVGLKDASSGLTVAPDGKVSLGTSGADVVALLGEVMGAVSNLARDLGTALVAVTTPGTPAPFDPATIAKIQAVKTTVDGLVTTLETIKR